MEFKDKAKEMFEKMTKGINKEKLESLASKSQEILQKSLTVDSLANLVENIKQLTSMIKDYASGKYKDVPWTTIASIGAALLYLLTPIDVIPDFIVGLGFLDDAFILKLCLDSFDSDIKQYVSWKSKNMDNN